MKFIYGHLYVDSLWTHYELKDSPFVSHLTGILLHDYNEANSFFNLMITSSLFSFFNIYKTNIT